MPSSPPDIETLPTPSSAERQLSEALLQRIAEVCASRDDGQIAFSEYMRMALYEPALGYYAGGLRKFGEQGDFITAPEVSALFSQCLANQIADILPGLDQGRVIEFGAGSGVMAADILLRLQQLDCLPDRYYILEVSAALRHRQRETLAERAPALLEKVIWLDAMPAEPFNAMVLANEVLDAMPVECFRKQEQGLQQMMVGIENSALYSDYVEASAPVIRAVQHIEQRIGRRLPQDYHSEVNLNIEPWLRTVFDAMQSGVVLLIDYGYVASEYYHPERSSGTLMCHYHHRAHPDPFRYPGLQDITTYVDFSDVAYSAADVGFEVRGFTSQAAFLMSSGLAGLHAEQLSDDARQQIRLSQQIKTLTLPSEMGERFKVMALSKHYDQPLTGFMLNDYRGKL